MHFILVTIPDQQIAVSYHPLIMHVLCEQKLFHLLLSIRLTNISIFRCSLSLLLQPITTQIPSRSDNEAQHSHQAEQPSTPSDSARPATRASSTESSCRRMSMSSIRRCIEDSPRLEELPCDATSTSASCPAANAPCYSNSLVWKS